MGKIITPNFFALHFWGAKYSYEKPDFISTMINYRFVINQYKAQATGKWSSYLFETNQKIVANNRDVTTQAMSKKKEITQYAQCDKNGILKVAHFFQTASNVPISDTPIKIRLTKKVTKASMGKQGDLLYFELSEQVPVTGANAQTFEAITDKNGIATFSNCNPNADYQIIVSPNVTQKDVNNLYDSYRPIVEVLASWLVTEWGANQNDAQQLTNALFKLNRNFTEKDVPAAKVIPEEYIKIKILAKELTKKNTYFDRFEKKWDEFIKLSPADQQKLLRQAELAGIGKAFTSIWEQIVGLWDLFANFKQNVEKIKKFFGDLTMEQINACAEKLYLILNDKGLLYILCTTLGVWFELLPIQDEAFLSTSIVAEIVISLVGGAALKAAGVTTKAAGATKKLVKKASTKIQLPLDRLVISFSAAIDMAFNTKQMEKHLKNYKIVATQGITKSDNIQKVLKVGDKSHNNVVPVARTPGTSGISQEKSPSPKQKTQSKDQTNNPQQSASCTITGGCPVSMVTGEELLTLTDGVLSGLLPFEWKRLYRTSGAEINNGLGYGWSHSLSHYLIFEEDKVLWINDENLITTLPLPTDELPDGVNPVAEAAIYLGDHENEYILARADGQGYYHFSRTQSGAQLDYISDPYDNRLVINRDLTGKIRRIHNNAGRALLLCYKGNLLINIDYQQQVAAATEEASWQTIQTLVSYEYNHNLQLIKATNAVGDSETYKYNELNVIQERRLAGGTTFYWEWENQGKYSRCLRHWNNIGQEQRYQWDDNGTVIVTNENNTQEIYTHDTETAKLLKQIDSNGAETLKSYDDEGRLILEKSPLGAETIYQYDDSGQLVHKVPAEGESIHYYYENGFVKKTIQGQAEWQYKHNEEGDILQQIDPLGYITNYQYTTTGKLQKIDYPDGSTHTFSWNKLGQLIEEKTPQGGLRRYRYDSLGHQIIRQDETGKVTQIEYDAIGRIIKVILPNGAQKQYQYNAFGKVTQMQDEQGLSTRYEYTPNTHLMSCKINPDGSNVQYRYNTQLNLTEIINEQNEHYHLHYNEAGLVSNEIGFDGRKTSYQYDLLGNLIAKTEYDDQGKQYTTQFTRSLTGKLLVKKLADGREFYANYDENGRLTSLTDGYWPINFEYDLAGKLIAEHQGWATIRYKYNALGLVTQYKLPDGNILDYHYSRGGQLQQIDLNQQQLTKHYYSLGQEIERQQGNLTSFYDYDERGQLKAHFINLQNKQLYQRQYQYAVNGNLLTIQDSYKGNRQFYYDPLDRLVQVRGNITENLIHDPAGNLLAQEQTQSNASQIKGNRLLLQGDKHFKYDSFGNLIEEKCGKERSLVTQYHYDCLHQLTKVVMPSGTIAEYQYDVYGRRIRKTITGKIGVRTKTDYIWMGDNIIAERSKDHYQSYLYEKGTHKPLALLKGRGKEAQIYFYQLDHLGTPQELTAFSGKIAWSASYKAYGNLAKLEVSEVDNPLRFQGQYFDQETGLHYNNYRYYNPNIGRYLTPDPIKLAGGLNSYQYTNNPINEIDPLGLVVCPRSTTVKTDPTSGAKFLDDIDDHLVSGHGVNLDHTKRSGGVSGTHNMENFEKIAANSDFEVIKKQISPGIYEVTYAKKSKKGSGKDAGKYILNADGTVKTQQFKNPKTVYDPKVYSDAQIKEWGKKAAFRGYNNARKQAEAIRIKSPTSNNFSYIEKEGSVTFEVWINFDKKLNDWIISSYYPIK